MKRPYIRIYFLFSLFFILFELMEVRPAEIVTKALPLLTLISFYIIEKKKKSALFLGFIFSLIGDIFLLWQHEYFIFGLASFLIAHLFYIAYFYERTKQNHISYLIPIFLYSVLLYAFLFNSLGSMRIPVFIYAFVISLMLWRSAEQYSSSLYSKWAFWGALSFTMSDSLIAIGRFKGILADFHYLIMISYYWGQYLIFYSEDWDRKRTSSS